MASIFGESKAYYIKGKPRGSKRYMRYSNEGLVINKIHCIYFPAGKKEQVEGYVAELREMNPDYEFELGVEYYNA